MNTMDKKNGQKKLLAAVAVFAMVACVFAAVPMADSEGAYEVTPGTPVQVTEITDADGVKGTGKYYFAGTTAIVISAKTADADVELYLADKATVTLSFPNQDNTGFNVKVYTATSAPDTNNKVSFDVTSEINFTGTNLSGGSALSTTIVADKGVGYGVTGSIGFAPTDAVYTTIATANASKIYNPAQAANKTFTLPANNDSVYIPLGEGENTTKYTINNNATESSVTQEVVFTGLTLDDANALTTLDGSVTVTNVDVTETPTAVDNMNVVVNGAITGGTVEVTKGRMYSHAVDLSAFGINGFATKTIDLSSTLLAYWQSEVVNQYDIKSEMDGAGEGGVVEMIVLKGTSVSADVSLKNNGVAIATISNGFATTEGTVTLKAKQTEEFYRLDTTAPWIGSVTTMGVVVPEEGVQFGDMIANGMISQVGTVDDPESMAKIYGTITMNGGWTLNNTALAIMDGGKMILGKTGATSADLDVGNGKLYVWGSIEASADNTDSKIITSAASNIYAVDSAASNIRVNVAINGGTPGNLSGASSTDSYYAPVGSYSELVSFAGQKFDRFVMETANGTWTIDDRSKLPRGITLMIAVWDATADEGNGAYVGTSLDLGDTSSANAKKKLTLPAGSTIVMLSGSEIIVSDGTADNSTVWNNVTFVTEGDIEYEGDSGNATIRGFGTFELATTGSVASEVIVCTSHVVGELDDAELSGTTTGSITFPIYQNVIVPEGKTLTIKKGNTITVNGNLDVLGNIVIEDGGMLVLGAETGKGATADFAGSVEIREGGVLSVRNADATVDGTFTIAGGLELANESTVTMKSAATVSNTGVLSAVSTTAVIVDSAATLTINGYVDNAYIDVLGGLVIDNAGREVRTTAGNVVNIDIVAEGAVVTINSFLFETSTSKITIKDVGLELGKVSGNTYLVGAYNGGAKKTFGTTDTENVIEISGAAATKLTGVIAVGVTVEKTKVDNAVTFSNIMNVSGAVNNSTSGENPAQITVTFSGNMSNSAGIPNDANGISYSVNGMVEVPAETTLVVSKDVAIINNGELVVAGYVDLTVDLRDGDSYKPLVNSDAKVTVEGKIKIKDTAIFGGVVNAAYYTTTEGESSIQYHVYSNLTDAVNDVLAETNKNTDKTVSIMGIITVTESVEIPAKVSVVFFTSDSTTNKLIIGTVDLREVTVTFKGDAGMASSSEQVDVYGTLVFENKTKDKTVETLSDVVVTDAEDKTGPITYTNIYDALADATDGETVKVTRDGSNGQYVLLTSSITVKDGVTLFIPAGSAPLKLNDGVTLTIDGTVESEEDIFAQTKFANKALNQTVANGEKSSTILVNGQLRTLDAFIYMDAANNAKNLEAGAPVVGAYYYMDGFYTVSPLEVAVANFSKIESDIVINGPVTAGDVTIDKAESDECERIIIGNTKVDDIGVKADGISTSLTANSLTISGISIVVNNGGEVNGTFTFGDNSVKFVKVIGATATEADRFTISDDKENLVLIGIAGIADASKADQSSFDVIAGDVELGSKTKAFQYSATGDKAILAVSATAVLVKVTDIDSLLVNGTVVMETGMTATVGTITVLGTVDIFAGDDSTSAAALNVDNVFIGITGADVNKALAAATGEAAVFNGPVADVDVAYILAGSTVDDATMDCFGEKYTEYYVEDALWITVYDLTGTKKITDLVDKVPVENAFFDEWVDVDGTEVEADKLIGDEDYMKVIAKIEYNVYHIVLQADEGIDNVSIDGNLMKKGIYNAGEDVGSYYAYMLDIAAGKHTIKYTLKNGYSGEAVMTVDGKAVTGLDFTTDGTPKDDKGITYQLQLTGIEKSGFTSDSSDSGDSGMGITDYLLIILVILVVVLAALVAMRMMRS